MAKKVNSPYEKPSLPNLLEPRNIVQQKIQTQIDKGKELLNIRINSMSELDNAKAELTKWSSYNVVLLSRLFDNSSIAGEFKKPLPSYIMPSLQQHINSFHDHLQRKITILESVIQRLDLYDEKLNNNIPNSLDYGQDIFVVHGHDEAAKEAVSRFVEKLGLNAIILNEKPSTGLTIIEKFEKYSDVGFAVVLLTPDDIGGIKEKLSEIKPRARQNVIFELGYFFGKLGRQHVLAIYKEEVDLPTDIDGVIYVPMDIAGAWRYKLANEMRAIGFSIDMNEI